jgi:pyrroline-5-carboxylate reductase
MEINKKIFFIGCGNMAAAIIAGILKAKLFKSKNIVCNDVSKEKALLLKEKFGVETADDKKDILNSADIIFLAVKPQNTAEVFLEIKEFLLKNTLFISIAAGITTKFIETSIGKEIAVVRAMPNTPSLVLEGMTSLCEGNFVSNEQLQIAKDLFSAIGKVEVLEEKYFDVITALSGSGPAYVFYLCELMQNAAEKLGLDKNTAQKLSIQTFLGSGKMLSESGETAKILKEKVTSPNGVTAMALDYFNSVNFSDIVLKAMEKAANRAKELNK